MNFLMSKDMYFIVIFTFLCACIPSYTKIYDCFTFFNELELLKMRLEELNDHVDYFVLVESVETQSGDPKPLYFQENQHFFQKYLPKIKHIVIDEYSSDIDPVTGLCWDRESFQRKCIMRGLQQCDNLDIIMISDLNEIPRAQTLETLKLLFYREKRKPNKLVIKNPPDAIALEMPLFIYQLNRKEIHADPWVGTVATLYDNVKRKGVQFFRDKRWDFFKVMDGGWHFTWIGDKNQIRQKLLDVEDSHKENVDSISDEEIETWIQAQEIIPMDSQYPNDFPKYMKKHIDYFKSIGYIAE
ncbi:MAG: hypothetical protein C5B45_02270 [Chlamydiae bacterium]|nr:MAG: hypothetical protein C5B45_02270 [Chlamydiota bacterium]